MTDRAEFFIKGRPTLAKPYHMQGVGLPNVYLLNGVVVENDPDYGEVVTVDNPDGLYRAIGLHIVEKASAITPAELRWLRKQMGLTQVQFGKVLRVSDQTVANYEKAATAISGPADTLARTYYLLHILPPESQVKFLQGILREIEKLRVPDLPRRKIVGRWQETATAMAA